MRGPPPRADNPDEIMINDDTAVEDSWLDALSGSAMVLRVLDSIAPSTLQNLDEITLDDEIKVIKPPPPLPPPTRETRFLALGKCLPHRQFLKASLSETLRVGGMSFSV
jgi:lariat debranching enzyme